MLVFAPFVCNRCDGQFKNVRRFRRHICPAKVQVQASVYDRAAQRYDRKQKARRLNGQTYVPIVKL